MLVVLCSRPLFPAHKFGLFCLFSVTVMALGVVHAQEEPKPMQGFLIEIWVVPASCGEQSEFEALVREAVGEWPEQTSVLQVAIEVVRVHRRFSLVMKTEGAHGSGRRELSARTCEELLQTGAVVLSLSLDPEALFRNEREPEVVNESPQTLPAASGRQALDGETPNTRHLEEGEDIVKATVHEPLNISLDFVGITEIGTLPRPALGLGVVLSAYSGMYRVSFRLSRWAEQVQVVGPMGDRGGTFDLLTGSMHVCRQVTDRLQVGACVVGSVGRVSAVGITDEPKAAENVLGSLGVSTFYNLPLGPTQIRLQAEFAGQFVRPRYLVTVRPGPTDFDRYVMLVHQPAPWTLRLGLGWGVSF